MTKSAAAISDTGAPQRIYRASELPLVTGYTRQHIYQLIADDKFPQPIRLGRNRVGWLESEVASWQREKIAERDKQKDCG